MVGDPVVFGVLGLVLGVAYAAAVVRFAPSAVRAFALGLAIAAAIYPAFAIFGGATWSWLGIELVGVVVFGALVLPALRGGGRPAAAMVALGWTLHPVWDLLLHASAVGAFPDAPGAGHVPSWYPPACATFDWVVALVVGALAYRSRAHSAGQIQTGASRGPR